MSIKAKGLLCAALAAIAAMAFAGSAAASQGISAFEMTPSTTAAGGHPDVFTAITLENPGEPEAARDVTINFPPGIFGNPEAISTCVAADFALSQCPIGSQAGLISLRANYEGNPNFIVGTAPLFVMGVQVEGETARFGFIVPGFNIPISIPVEVRTADDYGLRMTVKSLTQQLPLSNAEIMLWGMPADSVHDLERFPLGAPGAPAGCPGLSDASCNSVPSTAGVANLPLIDNPTICTGNDLTVELAVTTYQDPDNPSTAQTSYPATTDCEKQTFNPVLNTSLTSKAADAPAGLDLQLKVPQFLGHSVSPAQLRSATVILPEGLSINPDAADGQTACPDALVRFDSEGPAACPDSSKIGNFDIRTPALIGPLEGSLYFGEPKPGDQYRVIMVASGFGINAKLVASVKPDLRTGQITMSVAELPQVPFEQFNLRLFASQRGLIATPTHCRVYQADSLFVSWNDRLAPQRSRPTISIESGPNGRPCPEMIRPFSPRLEAGTSNPVAVSFSDFALKLDRDDGDQYLGDLNFRLPPGFTGSLRGIPYCSEAAIAAAAQRLGRAELANPSCPAASQVGTTNVAAGPGTHPFNAVGKMYLSGPLSGAPLSLAAITPALAGPFDYGNVVVRVGLHVDPITAQVSAVSETMPQIIGGVPIRMRSIRVNIDRPGFTINPTRCARMTVDSQGIGDQGTVTNFSSPFHAVNCANMAFKPRMAVRQLGGRKRTNRNQNPAMRFELRTRPGDANISRVKVTLPKAFAIDQRHLGNICSKAQLESELCAGRQKIGDVYVKTPLLDEPLRGPAYAVSGFGKLPRLAFILDGQVRLVPQAESASNRKGQLRTIVPTVPDAPIGYFRLDLLGGGKGYLVNTRSLCGSANTIRVDYVAQSGRKMTQKVRPKTACKGAKRTAKRSSHARGSH